MNRLLKHLVVLVLVILITLMGVLFYEERTIQTNGCSTVNTGSWIFGSREPKATAGPRKQDTRSGPYGKMGDEPTGSSRPEGDEPNQPYDANRATVTQNKDTASVNSNTVSGVGNIYSVTLKDGYRYYNADELEKGLLYELKPLAPYFIKAQDTYQIDAVFLAAVAAEESGWGRYLFRKNNIFGFENCDFKSLESCIDHAAKWLRTQYLTPGGMYYEGESVAEINIHYNGRKTWEANVTAIMGQIVKRIERTDTE